ncbi:hypothetical protein NIES4102_42020 (plasmid) [Chondrocystis sp. NIES-4102]|nr:hypothetical protein NIES4102_42020 [Chondrocystis sp. NIES-4102]
MSGDFVKNTMFVTMQMENTENGQNLKLHEIQQIPFIYPRKSTYDEMFEKKEHLKKNFLDNNKYFVSDSGNLIIIKLKNNGQNLVVTRIDKSGNVFNYTILDLLDKAKLNRNIYFNLIKKGYQTQSLPSVNAVKSNKAKMMLLNRSIYINIDTGEITLI